MAWTPYPHVIRSSTVEYAPPETKACCESGWNRTEWNTFFFSSLIAFLFGLYKGDALPSPAELLRVLENAPEQESVSMPPFETTVNDIVYRVKPLYRYELWGLVVSKHYADSLIDHAHKEWGDHLNTVDLCVIWGRGMPFRAFMKK